MAVTLYKLQDNREVSSICARGVLHWELFFNVAWTNSILNLSNSEESNPSNGKQALVVIKKLNLSFPTVSGSQRPKMVKGKKRHVELEILIGQTFTNASYE